MTIVQQRKRLAGVPAHCVVGLAGCAPRLCEARPFGFDP